MIVILLMYFSPGETSYSGLDSARFDREGVGRYPKQYFLPDSTHEDLKYSFFIAFSGALAAACRRG